MVVLYTYLLIGCWTMEQVESINSVYIFTVYKDVKMEPWLFIEWFILQLRNSVFQFCQSQLAPKAAEIDRTNDFKDMRVSLFFQRKKIEKLMTDICKSHWAIQFKCPLLWSNLTEAQNVVWQSYYKLEFFCSNSGWTVERWDYMEPLHQVKYFDLLFRAVN